MDGSPVFCRVRIPSAGITQIVFSGWMRVLMLYDQAHLLSLVPQAPRHPRVINMNSV